MSKIVDWWRQRKQRKLDALKEKTMEELRTVRMGDCDEINEHAAVSLLKAEMKGVQFDYSDPAFQFWRTERGRDVMHLAAEGFGEREKIRRGVWSLGFGIVALTATAAAFAPAVASSTAVVSILGIATTSVKTALGLMGCVATFGSLYEAAGCLFDKTKAKTMRLANRVLDCIRGGGDGNGGADRQHENRSHFFNWDFFRLFSPNPRFVGKGNEKKHPMISFWARQSIEGGKMKAEAEAAKPEKTPEVKRKKRSPRSYPPSWVVRGYQENKEAAEIKGPRAA